MPADPTDSPATAAEMVAPDGSRVNRRIFCDPDVYEREQQRIFAKQWLFVGHVSQVAAPGDYLTTYMGDVQVVVSRTDDGDLSVLVNSCRHRGVAVCRTDLGNTRRFTCPYHGWTYDTTGRLLGVPHPDAYDEGFDPTEWALRRVPNVATCFGLIFASFDPQARPLAEALGEDAVFYLSTIFDRDPDGIRVLGGAHRWRLRCNWKIPVENHAPDMSHVEPSHRAAFTAMGLDRWTVDDGLQISTAEGHMMSVRYLDESATVDERLPGHGMATYPNSASFFRDGQAAAERRLGSVRARISPMSAAVFPNFAVVPTNFTFRVVHPRGPSEAEIWSWCYAPASAPPAVAAEILRLYETMLGPAGLLEAEDGENWTAVSRGVASTRLEDRPFNLDMGRGRSVTHPDLPGRAAPLWSEHNQRAFYATWRARMGDAADG